jgi:hypothetical protein
LSGDQRQADRGTVEQGAMPDGGDDADGQSEDQPHDDAADRERDRRREVLPDLVEHDGVVDVAAAEVLVGEDVVDVVAELHDQRPVQAEVHADPLDDLRRRLPPRAERSRVGRREDVEDDERDAADEHQQQEHAEEAADDVSGH